MTIPERTPATMASPVETSERFYQVPESPELTALFEKIDAQRDEINRLKALHPELWATVQEKLRATWTYDSNALEGSTLTLGETIFFLKEGLTVEGKPLKDFLDARNHAEAIDFLRDVVAERRPITEGLIKEINALLMAGVNGTPAVNELGQQVTKEAHPGAYKTQPNHVLQSDGTVHRYVEPLQVPAEMAALCNWISVQDGKTHPIVVAAVAHYNMVRIHPFDDGNGRGARILMNLILLQEGYPPAVIRNETRRKYLEALKLADGADLGPFLVFVAEALMTTQDVIQEDLAKG